MVFHFFLGLFHTFLDAGGVDAAVHDELFDGQPGDFAPDGIERRHDHRFGGVVDDQIDAGGGFQGADVAPLHTVNSHKFIRIHQNLTSCGVDNARSPSYNYYEYLWGDVDMTIEEYITCEKTIDRKRKPAFKDEARHERMTIELTCPTINAKMSMFLRRLKDFPEDFTVGLKLDGPNEIMEFDVVLLRFQGPHGGQSVEKSMRDLHNSYHIHEYTQDDMNCRRKKASYKGQAAFDSFEEAIIRFMERCHIADPNGIFDEEREKIMQIRMDLDNLQ